MSILLAVVPPENTPRLLDDSQYLPLLVGVGLCVALLAALLVLGFARRG